MYLGERLRRLGMKIERRLLGPSIEDRDFPDFRPDNPARERFRAAEILARIETPEDALRQIRQSTVSIWSDYDYRVSFHEGVRVGAERKAREMGISEEQIQKARHEGNITGATARQGYRDYWM